MEKGEGAEEAVPLRLLCDAMLGSLARWLRAAGHDAALAGPAMPDAEVLAWCRREGRVLISRDRRLVREAAPHLAALLLPGDDPDEDALALARALGLDWLRAPLTRCVMDNAALRPASAEEMARVPERARPLPGPFRACPACGRIYWPGSHARRMAARLRSWREQAATQTG